MPVIRTVSSDYEPPNIPPGTYPMTCTGVRDVTLPDGTERLSWSFDIHGPNGGVVETEKLTSAEASPKSKAWEFLVALLGPTQFKPDQEFDTTAVIGHSALGTMGFPTKPDGQPGKFQLVSLVPLPQGYTVPARGQRQPAPAQQPAPTPIRQAAPPVSAQVGDDLPF